MSMKKILAAADVVVLLVVMACTCPSKESHCKAIKEVVSNAVNEKLSENSNGSLLKLGLSAIGTAVATPVVDPYLDANLDVEGYLFFNRGVLTYDGEQKTVSVGLFGHVFTFDKEDVIKALEKE